MTQMKQLAPVRLVTYFMLSTAAVIFLAELVGTMLINLSSIWLLQSIELHDGQVNHADNSWINLKQVGSSRIQDYLPLLRGSLDLKPDQIPVYRLWARLAACQLLPEEFTSTLENARKRYATDVMTNFFLGWHYWSSGDAKKAQGFFRDAPGSELALAWRASSYANSAESLTLATQLYELIMALEPKEASVYYDYGDLLGSLGSVSSALAWYERGKQYDYREEQFLERRAHLWTQLGRFENAIEDYRRLTLLRPDEPVWYYRLADLLRKLGLLREALSVYELGAQHLKETAVFHIRKSAILSELERYQEALDELQGAVRVDPSNYQAYFELGQALRLYAGDLDLSLQAYQTAVSLAPREMWPYIGIGEVYRARAQYATANEWFAKAAAAAPENSEPLYFYGLNALSQKDFSSAVSYLEQAVAFESKLPYLRSLGEAYAALGDYVSAIQVYQHLLEVAPDSDYARQRIEEWKNR